MTSAPGTSSSSHFSRLFSVFFLVDIVFDWCCIVPARVQSKEEKKSIAWLCHHTLIDGSIARTFFLFWKLFLFIYSYAFLKIWFIYFDSYDLNFFRLFIELIMTDELTICLINYWLILVNLIVILFTYFYSYDLILKN